MAAPTDLWVGIDVAKRHLDMAGPGLLAVRCRTPRQMHLANALARLWELAEVATIDA
jgi:hypothetical protein